MKIKLLIVSDDSDYVEHLSNILSEKYADTFEVIVCSSAERLKNLLAVNRFDTVLFEPSFASSMNLDSVRLPFILWDESEYVADGYRDIRKVRKYQRISSIAGNVLENYAEVVTGVSNLSTSKAHITAVWSPCGGVGKTTLSLAYAARKVSGGKQAVYLNLENFSSTSVYFSESGKSISTAFERLDANVHMLLMGIRQQDSGSGITYFSGPDNYDDMNILTVDDIETLINACAAWAEELVIDLPNYCDERIQKIFELADAVLLVCDQSGTAQVKLRQFINQHNVSQHIQEKSVLVNNKGSNITEASISKTIRLPLVQSVDPISVYKTLSGSNFEW